MENKQEKLKVRIIIAAHIIFCLGVFFKYTDEGKAITEKLTSVKGIIVVVEK